MPTTALFCKEMGTNKPKILVVEDESDIRDLMCLHLKREGYPVDWTDNGEEALKKLSLETYGLAVLDWMLPGISGLDVCKKIQTDRQKKFPVLMVTARADAIDIVLGLESGADDYVTKPFEIPVFLARVRALLRRSDAEAQAGVTQYTAGQLVLDTERHLVECAGKPVQLTPSEFKLLTALLRNQGRVLSRDRLIELVQGDGVSVVDRAIDTHVFGLRKKMGPCADVIETIRGVGYRVAAD